MKHIVVRFEGILLSILFVIFIVVGSISYRNMNAPYGIGKLYGNSYLGTLALNSNTCTNCDKRIYFWNTNHTDDCSVKQIILSQSGSLEDFGRNKRGDIVSINTISFDERILAKGKNSFIFDGAIYPLFERYCWPEDPNG